MMQITYQKRDGSTIQRVRKTMLPYKIGDMTSMKWKVLNIEYEYKNKYYSEKEYYALLQNQKQKRVRYNQTRELYISHLKPLLYYCIAVGLINLLKFIFGI